VLSVVFFQRKMACKTSVNLLKVLMLAKSHSFPLPEPEMVRVFLCLPFPGTRVPGRVG